MADQIQISDKSDLKLLVITRGIVIDNNGYILIMRRDGVTTWNPNRWEVPGGKPKVGENLNECIENEVFEETSLTVKIDVNSIVSNSHVEHDFAKYNGYLIVEVCAICRVIGYNNVKISGEHTEYKWVNKYEALTYDLTKQSRNAIAAFLEKI